MGRRRTVLVLLGLSALLMAVSAQGAQLRYKFSVTATEGPLAGVTSVGTFAFDDSIIPVGGGNLPEYGLLSDFNFTWHGIAYDENMANTGRLWFDSCGNLTRVLFGNKPTAGGASVHGGLDDWAVTGTLFMYSVLYGDGVWYGTFSYERALGVGVPGDYDGDARADIAIYRSSTGVWYIIPSGGGSPYGLSWGGNATDKPAPGDYDGDGKADFAIYRNGVWFIYPSGGGSAYAVGWGMTGDKPAPGDYDGDWKTDIAVYRPSTGVWYVIPSEGGSPYGIGWGGDPSDVPLTANPD